MSSAANEVIDAALKLDPDERQKVADALRDSLESDHVESNGARAKPWSRDAAERSVLRFVEEFSATDPGTSAVQDLIDGRR